MIEIVREMQRVRRRVAVNPERWSLRANNEVYDENNQYIGRFSNPDTANDVCSLHNVYLPVCNILVVMLQKRHDAAKMQKELDADAAEHIA